MVDSQNLLPLSTRIRYMLTRQHVANAGTKGKKILGVNHLSFWKWVVFGR